MCEAEKGDASEKGLGHLPASKTPASLVLAAAPSPRHPSCPPGAAPTGPSAHAQLLLQVESGWLPGVLVPLSLALCLQAPFALSTGEGPGWMQREAVRFLQNQSLGEL